MTREDKQQRMQDWIRYGIDNGFCTEVVCQSHDGVPLTPEEEKLVEVGEDICIFLVRINNELISDYPFKEQYK
jgi:hypothetical protein